MKIAFEINEKYKKPEIHICSDRDDHESRKIYMTVMEVFEKNITAYDDNEPVMIRHGDIVRIFTQNKMCIFSLKRGSTGSGSGYMSWRIY